MKLGDALKLGFKYPVSNFVNLLIFGVICTLVSVIGSLGFIAGNNLFFYIGAIVSFVLSFVIIGYSLDIINEGLKNSSEMPMLNGSDFLKGIKVLVVQFVYYLIPLIIVLVVAYFSGLFTTVPKILSSVSASAVLQI